MGFFDRFFKSDEDKATPDPKFLKEKAVYDNDIFASNSTLGGQYNPDELVGRKGAKIYTKMMRDPQVKSAMYLILDIATSRPYRFVKPDDSPLQEEIEEFFQYNINSYLRKNFSTLLRFILTSKVNGFSVSEKVFDVDKYRGSDKWLLRELKLKPFDSFIFDSDKYGNLKSIKQEAGNKLLKLDPDKFIVHVNNPEFDPIWGESDLRSAYRAFWEKDNFLKFWAIYIERLAGGFVLAKPGDMAAPLSAQEAANFDNALRRTTMGTAMRVPLGWDVDIVQPNGTDAFERAIAMCDKQISRALMVPNLLGLAEQDGVGSFAQSQTQLNVFLGVISSQLKSLADVLNEQLFSQLAMWNYGVVEHPMIEFDESTDEQKAKVAEAWSMAVEKGIVLNTFDDELKTRDLLGYDPREEQEEGMGNPELDQENEPVTPEADETNGEVVASEDEGFAETNVINDKFEPANIVNDVVTPKSPYPDGESLEGPDERTDLTNRIDFGEVEQMLDTEEAMMVDSMSEGVDMAFSEISSVIEQIITNEPNPESDPTEEDKADKNEASMGRDILILDNAISVETKQFLNKSIRESLSRGYADGRVTAQKAIDIVVTGDSELPFSLKKRITFASKVAKRTAVKFKQGEEYSWSVLDFVEGLRLDTAEKYFQAKAFEMTGSLTGDMLDKAKTAILNGIKNESSLAEIIAELEELLSPVLGSTIVDDDGVERKLRPRLETIARTNISDAFNQANLAVYNDPDLGDFVQAYEYTAILDSRTTPFCSSYNGKVFRRNDPIWGSITPPNHFNCRSTIIPVTQVDGDVTVSEKSSDTKGELLQPGKGFGIVKE